MARHLLIGGTGTLGTALAERLKGNDVTVFSRGELAQKQMAQKHPEFRYLIGDVRDRRAIQQAMGGIEVVFLLAAIKHVDVAEQNPLEAIKTNVDGAVNVAEVAIAAGARHVVFSNTDKAVLPITTYGYTKALAQNYLLAQNGRSATRFSAFAWGNICASRGSVIPTFVKALLNREMVPITDPAMSRFWLTIDTAADFMFSHYEDAPSDKAMVPPVKGATVVRVVESIARILKIKNYVLGNTGLRGVEKYHEVLESSHDHCLRSDTCPQYSDDDLDELLRETVLNLAGGKYAESSADRRSQRRHGQEIRRHLQVSGGECP